MYLINIIVALIVAIGFWKTSSKDVKRKIAHASRTKFAIFFVLTVATIFFYVKSYQVATFRNYISIKCYKGSYDFIENRFKHDSPRDTVKEFTIVSRFSNDEISYNDPLTQYIKNDFKSGYYCNFSFENSPEGKPRLYTNADSLKNYKKFDDIISILEMLEKDSNITHLYDIEFYANTIPSIFPFSLYEEEYKEEGNIKDINGNQKLSYFNSNSRLSYEELVRGKDYDVMFVSRFATYFKKEDPNPSYIQTVKTTKTINTLNFFSAADLSQCNYEIIINSDIPVESLRLLFDIPIEVSALGIERDKVTSRSFTIGNLNVSHGKTKDFRHFHINFPTLSNFQLIRSLILTTMLTALIPLTLANMYYCLRKRRNQFLKIHSIPFAKKRKMRLLWIPVGKFVIWSMIAAVGYLLYLSITNNYYSVSLQDVHLINRITLLIVISYISIIVLASYLLYRRNIYPKDIIPSIVKLIYCVGEYSLEILKKIKRNNKQK